jgi:hypothetical protein
LYFYDGFVTIAGELNWALKKSGTIESSLNSFFATGNLSTTSGLGLLQDKGMFLLNNFSFKRQTACFWSDGYSSITNCIWDWIKRSGWMHMNAYVWVLSVQKIHFSRDILSKNKIDY